MWLLSTTTHLLHDFLPGTIPPYAILSHTWGSEEVTLQDILLPSRTPILNKAGYLKILLACAVALSDGFDHIWIDTCCIDKKSSAELSEAINSMFRYYAEAARCYAYLSDVADPPPASTKSETEISSWLKSSFAASRWFTRSWTLQELIAPKDLQFYSADWKHIGSISSAPIQAAVKAVTGINVAQVHASHLSDFSVAQRMSWAAGRQATRLEDEAYGLLGIFGICMPLLYGEGRGAFGRLLEEIVKGGDDHSVFAWVGELDGTMVNGGGGNGTAGNKKVTHQLAPNVFKHAEEDDEFTPIRARNLFATSAAEYASARNIVELKQFRTPPYALTNQGLSITLPCMTDPDEPGRLIAVLNCGVPGSAPGRLVGIYLQDLRMSVENALDLDANGSLKGPWGRVLSNQRVEVPRSWLGECEMVEVVVPKEPERWQMLDYFAEFAYRMDEEDDEDSDE